jgi:selenocysteine-specific elongation factor
MIHCGLFGHVDAGKTSVARVLTEIVSTAGLDAHPQSKKRGTIDLGFTSFQLGEYQVALVDAPGHADLIRSAVASASIIDVAILVIDAQKGPEVQTGEHMVILEALGITRIVVAMNKIDLLPDEAAIDEKAGVLKAFLEKSGPPFATAPVIPISAEHKTNVDGLLAALHDAIDQAPITRDVDGDLFMLFDHHFQVKGFGTVITGTILSGTVRVGDTVEISPLGMAGKVKTINMFKEEREIARAGDRAGMSIAGIDNEKLFRGCVVCTPGTVQATQQILVEGKLTRFFKHELAFKSQVHLTTGMYTVPASFFPYARENDLDMIVDTVANSTGTSAFTAFVRVSEPIPCRPGMPLLISRLDLKPTELRIAAGGRVAAIVEEPPVLYRMREKVGKIKDPDKGVVEGLAESITGAEFLARKEVLASWTEDHGEITVKGRILGTFGTKGNVRVDFEGPVSQGAVVKLQYPRAIKI